MTVLSQVCNPTSGGTRGQGIWQPIVALTSSWHWNWLQIFPFSWCWDIDIDWIALLRPVRIRVRTDSPHPLVCRKRRLMGWSFGWDRKNRGPVSQQVWHDKDPSLLKGLIFWNRAHSGCGRSNYTHSSTAPDPTFAFVKTSCCPTLDFILFCSLDDDY
jgi:hypothetical protein